VRTLRYDLLACLALLTFAALARADDYSPRAVSSTTPQVTLTNELEVLADPAGTLTIEQVSGSNTKFGNPPVTTTAIIRNHVYWIRFRLNNPGAAPQAIFIEPGQWDEVQLFTPSVAGYREQVSGLLLPDAYGRVHMAYLGLGAKAFFHKAFFLEVELPPATVSTFYLRVENSYRFVEPATIQINVFNGPTLRVADRSALFYQGIFLGTMLALFLYNFVLFVRLRDASYGYYALHLVGFAVLWANNYNLSIERFWPSWPVWDYYSRPFALLAMAVGLVQFTRHYLDTRRTLPYFDILLRLFLTSQLLLLVAIPFAKYPTIIALVAGSGRIIFPLILLVAIGAVRCSHPLAKYFLAANLCTSIGHAILFAALFDVVPRTTMTLHSGELGVSLEAILLSLGLAYRIRRLSEDAVEYRLAEARMQRALEEERRSLIEQQNLELERKVAERTADLTHERERTELLLRNILPAAVAEELKTSGRTEPRRFEEVSILFTDFAGFTQTVGTIPAKRMVEELNDIFAAFDDIVDKHGLEKIKTIGDAYMAAAGLPEPAGDHAARCVRAALDMVRFIAERNRDSSIKWELRAGIHSGPVVAGVVGKRKYAYDIWGDTVNIASRMESAGEPGRVNLSAYTYDLVRDRFDCEYRGKIGAKGKGDIDMYFVKSERAVS